jgi:hypothetical protein
MAVMACGGRDERVHFVEAAPAPSVLDAYRAKIDPAVWDYIVAQPWFSRENTNPAHIRLIELVATYLQYATTTAATDTIAAYPSGVNDEMLQAIQLAKDAWPVRDVLTRPWFRDGVTPTEYDLLSAAVSRKLGINTFSIILEEAERGAWYKDGLDAAESELLAAVFALGLGNSVKEPMAMLEAVAAGRYVTERVTLPLSGEKGIVVVGRSLQAESRLADALALVTRYLPEVEAIAGPYTPRYVVAQVVDLDANLCGQGVPQAGNNGSQDDRPGVIRLKPSCVIANTTVHELAHVFVGIGPVWFTEGVADLIALRLTRQNGGHLARRVEGKIELEWSAAPGTPRYVDQGALGAQFLVAADKLIGPDAMNAAIRELSVSAVKRRTGQLVLDTLISPCARCQQKRARSTV